MPINVLPKPEPLALDTLLRSQAAALHANDAPPADRKAWEERLAKLRQQMFAAMGAMPEKPLALEPQVVGTLKRDGYRIDKMILQTRPDVWMTTSLYVPDGLSGKAPAVLVVHGHWPMARRDPVVQARCLGLVKLGFIVLAVDAFGAGERFTKPASGTYHGALFGSALWPAGQTLLGMQVYDNRRAVDYLVSRPDVDASRLGVTGASGGGNQTMYAGALDERFGAVVPVCSVGNYQAYLHAACCVCEVLPGALRFCEEGDVLSLVAPRALLVINATKDGFQFSVNEAKKSLERARPVFELYDVKDKLAHGIFESPHAYNQSMRELMYGWMTRWLKGEGDGKPIAEPKHTLETPADLACFPDLDARSKSFLFPPSFAAREARQHLAKLTDNKPKHTEDWESTAVFLRHQLRKQVLGEFPKLPKPDVAASKPTMADGIQTATLVLTPEPGLPLPTVLRHKQSEKRQPACVLLHLGGKDDALQHPVASALVDKGWLVAAPDLRGTGETRAEHDAILGVPDHNTAEHALWLGRPLLGQWTFDLLTLLDWLGAQPSIDARRLSVVGLEHAGVIALVAAALLESRIASAASLGGLATFVTESAYATGTPMGLLAPGLLRWADVPHLAALAAPRRLILAEATSPQGQRLTADQLTESFSYTRSVYELVMQSKRLTVADKFDPAEVASTL
jgi:dienelactone hydrolase